MLLELRKQYWADLLLLLVVIIWGSTFPVMKLVLADLSPFYYILLRFTLAFSVLGVLYYKRLQGISIQALKKGLILGCWLFSGYAFQIIGLQYTTASRSGFITGLAVIMVPFLAVVLLKEVLGFFNWLGVLLAVVGLFLLTGSGENEIYYGDYLTLLCALSFAVQIVLLSKYLAEHDPVILTVIQLAVVTVGSLLLTGLRGEFQPLNLQAVLVIVYTGLVATAFSLLIQSYAQQYTSSTHTALIFTLEPVFAAFFAYLVLGEILERGGIIGGFLIIVGMLIAELMGKNKEKRGLKASG